MHLPLEQVLGTNSFMAVPFRLALQCTDIKHTNRIYSVASCRFGMLKIGACRTTMFFSLTIIKIQFQLHCFPKT